VTENRHEYRNVHKSNSHSSLPDLQNSHERNNMIHSASGGSVATGGNRAAGSYDTGVQSRTYDGGRGKEERREHGRAYTTDDGTFVSYDRKEVKNTHSSGSVNRGTYNSGSTAGSFGTGSGSAAGSFSTGSGSTAGSLRTGSGSSSYYAGDYRRSGSNNLGSHGGNDLGNAYSASRTTYIKSTSDSHSDSMTNPASASHMRDSGVYKNNKWYKERNQEYYDYYDESDPEINKIDSNTDATYSRVEFENGKAKTVTQHGVSNPTSQSHFSGNNYRTSSYSDGKLQNSLYRVRRNTVIKSEAFTDDQTGKTIQVVNLNCQGSSPTARCIPITCTLRNLGAQSSASIVVTSRLWNATLVEDYANVNLVNIQSRAELILDDSIRLRQDQSDDEATATTKAYANLLEQSQAVPLWVILLSIFAGLLILILIIVVLWKMGFFERNRRPDPTLSGNIAKNGY